MMLVMGSPELYPDFLTPLTLLTLLFLLFLQSLQSLQSLLILTPRKHLQKLFLPHQREHLPLQLRVRSRKVITLEAS